MDTPICEFAAGYAARRMARLHMPGHKGTAFLGCEAGDITEIDGADELYDAAGIIAASERNAARLFGSGRTLYGTEGSSQCIRAMLFLAMQAAEGDGERPLVLAGRNAHKAFLYGCALLDLDVEWLLPEAGASLCACPIPAEAVARRLSAGRKPIALYVTAPDYLGGTVDIAALAALCRTAGIPLLVDHAHGAYLKFLQSSRHALDLGAAMCCDSAHKTLPVLTGGAYLHLSAEWAEKVGAGAKQAMALFGSTSPSYLILQSLDRCNRYLAEGYPARLAETAARLEEVREALRRQGWAVRQSDPLKVTIETARRGYTGTEIAARLRAGGVECEFADPEHVVLMATPENTAAELARVAAALAGAAAKEPLPPLPRPVLLPRRMGIRAALFAPSERIPCEQAIGRICGAPCVSCPPAIPIAVSGEEITAEATALFRAYGVETVAVVRA